MIERQTNGEGGWTLTGSGFYNPRYKISADACCAKWNAAARDPNSDNASFTTKYEYRVRTYTRP